MEMIFTESNLSSLDRAFLVIEKQNDIAMGSLMLEFETSCKLDSIYYEKFGKKNDNQNDNNDFEDEDDDEEPKKKKVKSGTKKSIFTKICDAITAFIHSILHLFQNMFGKGTMVKPDEYFKSKSYKVEYAKNMNQYIENVEEKVNQGHKIINMIANKTPIPNDMLIDYYEIGAGCVVDSKDSIYKATVGWATNQYMHQVFTKGMELTKDMKKTIENADLSDKELDQAIKAANHMNGLLRGLGEQEKSLSKKLFGFMRRKK